MRTILQRIACCGAVIFLTGFHGCLNEKVHQQTHASTAGKIIRYVDTRSGTGGPFWLAGQNSPAVQVPWGQVKLGPDTTTWGRMVGMAGYYYPDVNLKGFSHTRLVGAGVYEGGTLRVMPSTVAMDFGGVGHHAPTFNHRNETAVPGYYSVTLDKTGIRAELTATARVGLHRYTFPSSSESVLYIDLSSHLGRGGRVADIAATVAGSLDQITGSLKLLDDFSSRYSGLQTYFDIRLPTAATSYRFLTATGESQTAPTNSPNPLYLELKFNGATTVEMRTAISYVSIAGATANLLAEAPLATSFDTVMASTQNTWENLLGRVTVTNGPETTLQTFYTALYNSCRMPTLFGDYDAAKNENYTGFDKQGHTTAGFSFYSDFSLWDTFRTVHPLYLLIARTEQNDMLQSLLTMAQQTGRFPRWASGLGNTDAMLGFPAAMTLSESYLKGLTTFGAATAYNLLKQHATVNSGLGAAECFDLYNNLGYCPYDQADMSVTRTLEYAYADAAMALWAEALGNTTDAEAFAQRSRNYENVWNTTEQAFMPRKSDGTFMQNCRLDQLSYIGTNACSKHYTEGSGLQYRWYLPFNMSGLMTLFTGDPYTTLETLFQRAPAPIATAVPNPYYWHGNEPGLLSVTVFNHMDRPYRTQYWTDWIRRTKYDNTSIGLDGNDDGGTLSAWYVFAGFGFLPIAGTGNYEIVAPLFDKVTLNMGGPTLDIVATGASEGKRYVTGATIGGTRLAAPRFTHSQISGGGQLILEVTDTPGAWVP